MSGGVSFLLGSPGLEDIGNMKEYDPIASHQEFLKSQKHIVFLEAVISIIAIVIVSTFLYKTAHHDFLWWYLLWLIILPGTIFNFFRSLRLYRKSKAYLQKIKGMYDTEAN
jgi:hypothetical protein